MLVIGNPPYDICSNRFGEFGHKSTSESIFNIKNCKSEYQKYQPQTFASKTCSRVRKRKCVVNKYCKGDIECIEDAKAYYYPYLVKNDEEYCSCLVQAEKGERDFKECDTIK